MLFERARTRIAAVIFDFDGVLADTERLHLGAFQEVFASRGWTLDDATYFDRYLGCDDHGLVVTYARDRGLALDDADVRRLVESKTATFARLLDAGAILYHGAGECVERLGTKFPLGIASGALRQEIVRILDAAGLTRRFAAIVAADDVTACKPAPEPYLKAAAALGAPPAECIAIEDSGAGLEAAHAAGMRTIAITTTSPRTALARADYVIGSLDEVSVELMEQLAVASS